MFAGPKAVKHSKFIIKKGKAIPVNRPWRPIGL
jgi:hypothetical protein